jgi:hypothetical protein
MIKFTKLLESYEIEKDPSTFIDDLISELKELKERVVDINDKNWDTDYIEDLYKVYMNHKTIK